MRMTTMTKKGRLRVFVAAVSIALCAATARASTPAAPADLRVINDHGSPVRVFVQDAEGRRHDLGRVGRSAEKVLEISDAVLGRGPFVIEVLPDLPAGAPPSHSGLRARDLLLMQGESLRLQLGTNLSESKIEITRG
jgi:hypothetical protein